MGWYQKIQFYRSLLIGFWCINIVLICTTLVAGFRYFQSSQRFEESLNNQRQLVKILSLEKEIALVSTLPKTSTDDAYEYRKRTDALKQELKTNSDLPKELSDFANSNQWQFTQSQWSSLRNALLTWSETQIKISDDGLTSITRTTKELIFLGSFTLIFGILLPLVVFAFLAKTLLKAKKSLEEKVATWISQVLQKIPTDATKPYTNPVLWLEVITATLEIFAPGSRHPLIMLLRESIPTIRNEFGKTQAEPKNGSV